ncbi:tRNA lysidine(34) synthetase TilS [Ravibacter arvi]|uniref:tRNA(Ile)-lysidine synthase n=1 Tax=Ravibacter arvi TaxID=2051041 RepID=A0ABP8M3Z3_9BACT
MLSSFLTESDLLAGPDHPGRILLAVSGGVDSVVMAHLYRAAGRDCAVAHCNFNLRGEASDADARLVRQLSKDFGFTYHEITFQTREYAEKWKLSTQMAARRLRYEWFSELADTYAYDLIAVAHHADDQVETVLLNLVRGAGVKGLRGMLPRNGRIIRPLLNFSRGQIEQYAAENGLVWREDQSNRDVYYRRNRIRQEVVPVLRKINPSLTSTVGNVAERVRGAELLLEHALVSWEKEAVSEHDGEIRIEIDAVRNAVSPAFQLHRIVEPFGFSYRQAKEIAGTLDGLSGKIFLSATHRIVKDRNTLILAGIERETALTDRREIEVVYFEKPENFEARATGNVAYFDADRLHLPLALRNWEPGDAFSPYGMKGRKKKVSDLLIDLKIDLVAKSRVRVLTDREGCIVWLVGIRGGHAARVTPETTRIAKVSISEG